MIGEAPRTEAFRSYFDWDDAVIHMPFDRPDVAAFLEELDAQPERLARIRRENVGRAALRHDWLHRLEAILDRAGLPHTVAMQQRQQQLQALSDLALRSPLN
jgi:hypothetical protein